LKTLRSRAIDIHRFVSTKSYVRRTTESRIPKMRENSRWRKSGVPRNSVRIREPERRPCSASNATAYVATFQLLSARAPPPRRP
jgi:hypothetical protein